MSRNISLENSFKRVLRKHGYYYVKTGDDDYMFIKHDDRIGGIYFELEDKAKMRIEKTDSIKIFENRKSLNKYLKEMEKELNYLNPALARTLDRKQIKKLLKEIDHNPDK
ncbi:MAG: hypothetical protein GF329_21730 [Candidatus Lokiarchaeota archaeon]|nr:hypothetical protein [Candidatus Lokiarchaeota archaeon]